MNGAESSPLKKTGAGDNANSPESSRTSLSAIKTVARSFSRHIAFGHNSDAT